MEAVLEHVNGGTIGGADEKVEVAIAVGVAERGAGQGASVPQTQASPLDLERAIAAIPVVLREVGARAHEVDVAIAVDVAGSHAPH